jgi:hypothetical protein
VTQRAVWCAGVLALGLGLSWPAAVQSKVPDLAASPVPHPAMRRVEVPAHGIALALRDGWTAETLDIYRGAAPFAGLFAESPSGRARCQARATSDHVWYSPEDPTAGIERLIEMEAGGRGNPPTATVIALPAGPAIRFDDVMSDATATGYWPALTKPWRGEDWQSYAAHTSYLILAADGTAAARLDCERPYSRGVPTDHWLSIAKTFEFLPGGPAGGPSPGRRLEVPELGIAVSLPDDWNVEQASGGVDASWPAIVRPEELGPDVSMDSVFVASAPDTDDEDVIEACTLVQYRPTDTTPEELIQLASRHEDRDTAYVVDEPLDPDMGQDTFVTEETLMPGMRRLRLESWDRPFTEQYAIAGHDAVALLWCRGPWTFGDRWLAIAETIESFPSDE